MAASKIVMQSADGASVGLTIPDGLTSGERTIALGANLSGVTAYHLLNGEVSVSNGVITSGFSTTLFSRTAAGSFTVNSGIDMDTQWGNTAEEKFGGLVWVKDRVSAGAGHVLHDTIRGAGYYIQTNNTGVNTYLASTLVSFNNNGFTYGDNAVLNASNASWNFQTTHRRTGTTNHGKAFTEHYNPFTGFTMIKYEGSGLAGHEIPHSLGRKLGFYTCKQLDGTYNWVSQYRDGHYLYLNGTNAELPASTLSTFNETNMSNGTTAETNGNNLTYIMYGWANSYFDESNKLIGNYEIGVYQGTGASGNKVTTKGKPAWIMVKRLDATGNWVIVDNKRGNGDYTLLANTADVEDTIYDYFTFLNDGFTNNSNASGLNASGGQYLYMVVYDNDNGSGKSKYQKATDSSQLQINALIPFANGVDGNGAKNTILSKNETITGLTLTQGKNYVYGKNDGSYGVKPYRPRYLSSDLVRTYAGESPDYYDVKSNKWFNTDAGSELVTNGTGLSLTGWVAKDVNSGYPDSTLLLSNQTIVITNSSTAGSNGGAYQLLTGLTVGKKYKVKLSQDGTVQIQVGTTSYLSSVRYATSSVGATEFEFIAQATSVYLTFYNSVNTANDSCWIDNVSCFQTDITPTSEITDSRNYLDAIIYADHNGQIEYVEQLPKTQYVDEIKANEFKGKNACTAWVNFDGTTTPPTIRDSYNVSAVVRTSTGGYDIYFKTLMDTINYAPTISANKLSTWADSGQAYLGKTVSKLAIINVEGGVGYNVTDISVHIYGGKN